MKPSFHIRTCLAGFLSLCLILLSGCDKTEWVARWADTYIAWKINHEFDFSGDSKKLVKSESDRFVKDVRRKEFPKIAQYFRTWSQELSTLNFNQEDTVRNWVRSKVSQSEFFLDQIKADAEPFALKVAAKADSNNWQAFQKDFEKDNSKLLKEKSKCTGHLQDELEDWLGSLTNKQIESTEKYCQTRKDSQEVRVRNRQHLMQVFRSWAEPRPGEFNSLQFQAAARRWIENYRDLQSPESIEKWKNSRQVLIQELTQILVSSSETQRKHLRDRLDAYAENLQKLSL